MAETPPIGHLLHAAVLLLEDNVLIAMDAECQLQELGAARVDVAGSVRAALQLMAGHDYQFAVLDVNLGGENSRQVAEALAARGIPFVFTTGYGALPWQGEAGEQAPVVAKPLNLPALQQAIARALAR